MENGATEKQVAFLLKKNYPVEVVNQLTKQSASSMIDAIVNKDKPKDSYEKKEFTTYNKPKSDNSSYYVAYAKDLAIAMLESATKLELGNETRKPINVDELFRVAVNLIREARDSF